jgi:hypothetical protein
MESLCVILTGQMRTFKDKDILNSYNKYLSGYGNVDLYIYTWRNIGYSNNHGNTNIHDTQNDVLNKNDIYEHYSKISFITIKEIIIDDFESFYDSLNISLKNIYKTPFRDHAKVTTSIPIEYKYQQAINSFKTNDIYKYNNVLITRPDMELICNIPFLSLEKDTVYFSSMCVRCMDHGWFGTPNTLVKQLNNIFDNYENNFNIISSSYEKNRDNNELLFYQCEINNIKIIVENKQFLRQKIF